MKTFIYAVVLALVLCTVSAYAAETGVINPGDMYFGAQVGAVNLNDVDATTTDGGMASSTFSPGIYLGAVVGYKLETPEYSAFRVEGEFGYRSSDVDTTVITKSKVEPGKYENDSVQNISLMFNVFYDLGDPSDVVIPYIGAGVGVANTDLTLAGVQGDNTGVAYQAIAGVSLNLRGQMLLDISYRYFGTQDAKYAGQEVSYGTHNVVAGIRF
jgi:opacity protein-like surface antigen